MLAGDESPPAVRYPRQIEQRDGAHRAVGAALCPHGRQGRAGAPRMVAEETYRLLDARVLGGRAQGETVEEGEQGGAVAAVEPPEERVVVAARAAR